MDELGLISLMRDVVWTSIAIATPILSVALITGIIIGLMQALTSIQELTLTFVPKLIAIAITFWITMSFMTRGLVSLWQDRLIPLIAGG